MHPTFDMMRDCLEKCRVALEAHGEYKLVDYIDYVLSDGQGPDPRLFGRPPQRPFRAPGMNTLCGSIHPTRPWVVCNLMDGHSGLHLAMVDDADDGLLHDGPLQYVWN